jgi:hypothetical protein
MGHIDGTPCVARPKGLFDARHGDVSQSRCTELAGANLRDMVTLGHRSAWPTTPVTHDPLKIRLAEAGIPAHPPGGPSDLHACLAFHDSPFSWSDRSRFYAAK